MTVHSQKPSHLLCVCRTLFTMFGLGLENWFCRRAKKPRGEGGSSSPRLQISWVTVQGLHTVGRLPALAREAAVHAAANTTRRQSLSEEYYQYKCIDGQINSHNLQEMIDAHWQKSCAVMTLQYNVESWVWIFSCSATSKSSQRAHSEHGGCRMRLQSSETHKTNNLLLPAQPEPNTCFSSVK